MSNISEFKAGALYQRVYLPKYRSHLELKWHPELAASNCASGGMKHEASIRERIHMCGACYCDERQHNDRQRSMLLSSLLQ
jgi:hypothetical protein